MICHLLKAHFKGLVLSQKEYWTESLSYFCILLATTTTLSGYAKYRLKLRAIVSGKKRKTMPLEM